MSISQFQYQQMLERTLPKIGSSKAEHGNASKPCEKEVDLHDQIINECKKRGWIYLHGSTAEATHRTLGEPDFTILADGGRVFFVECKTRIGKLSTHQLALQMVARKLGHEIHVVRSFAEFLLLVKIYNKL